jgi:hypothetical protein
MAEVGGRKTTPEGWIIEDEPADLPPPEPAPEDWTQPAPVETEIEAPPGVEVETEDRELESYLATRRRRLWTTTGVFAGLWLLIVLLFTTEGGPIFVALFMLPFYLTTLLFVLRRPKHLKGKTRPAIDRSTFYRRLMVGVAAFLIVYLPLTVFTNAIIPYAVLVEYVLFAFLLFLLLRIGGRSPGVAPSVEALPPPSHRLHQQVVAPIDDAHYQRTLWLNYSFVEKARGGKTLARRLDEILEANGVAPDRREGLLSELHAHSDEGGLHLFGRGRERRSVERERRRQVLERLYASLNQELEYRA